MFRHSFSAFLKSYDISEFHTVTCLDNQSTFTSEPFEYLLNQSQALFNCIIVHETHAHWLMIAEELLLIFYDR